MAINRKEFIAKACLAGACMRGFGLPVFAGAKKPESE